MEKKEARRAFVDASFPPHVALHNLRIALEAMPAMEVLDPAGAKVFRGRFYCCFIHEDPQKNVHEIMIYIYIWPYIYIYD